MKIPRRMPLNFCRRHSGNTQFPEEAARRTPGQHGQIPRSQRVANLSVRSKLSKLSTARRHPCVHRKIAPRTLSPRLHARERNPLRGS
jgi:hypothetical protein